MVLQLSGLAENSEEAGLGCDAITAAMLGERREKMAAKLWDVRFVVASIVYYNYCRGWYGAGSTLKKKTLRVLHERSGNDPS